MKTIPIVILNKDRLEPLRMLVESLRARSYNNIIIIDNQTTYQPTLDWYKQSNVNVFYNDIDATLYDTGTFYRLAFELNHPIFSEIVKDYYVFTDSDVVPADDIPDDFIDSMISVCSEFGVTKVGLGLKIDDLPDSDFCKHVISNESPFWVNQIPHDKYTLYHAAVDTTFAVYQPNSVPLLNHNCIRIADKFVAKHMPWYYDPSNMPADEYYYLTNLHENRGPAYSPLVKNMIQLKKRNNEK
jgi:hypothetical protein